ncbi:hypothetical protein [Streptomyces sp. NPDC001980]|uniref:hypothetical protein n=1 Tax=Streptomyces sp. NPDC001980 TaxID=3157126 RepID=UPI0033284DAB
MIPLARSRHLGLDAGARDDRPGRLAVEGRTVRAVRTATGVTPADRTRVPADAPRR